MTRSTRRFAILSTVVLSATLTFGAGCGDTLSYSAQARRDGIRLYNDGQYTDAAGAFNSAVRQNPRDHISFYYLGQSYEKTGDWHRAIQSYKTSLDVMPYTIHNRRDEEFRDRATDALASAIARSPSRETEINALVRSAEANQSAGDYFKLARIFTFAGDADAALDSYNRAMLLAPQDQKIHRTAGLWLESIGQNQAAERPLRRAYALNDQDADVIAALRRLNIVTGPSLKEADELARPIVPKGPIPELEIPGITQPSASTGAN